jgi:hypothetical protein
LRVSGPVEGFGVGEHAAQPWLISADDVGVALGLAPAVNQSASVPPVVAVPGSRPHMPGSAKGLPVEVPRTWPVTWRA